MFSTNSAARLAPFLFAATFASAAPAQPFMQYASCTTSGCTCSATRMTVAEIADMVPLGAIPDDADTLVIVRDPEGRYFWTDMAPADIDLTYGGPGNCPLQLFDEFTPEDGTWQINVGTTDTSACQMLRGQKMSGGLQSETRQLVWNGHFHPETLLSEAQGNFRWTETGRLSWRGVLFDERVTDGVGATGASVVQTLRLVSPTEITGSSIFEYDISSTAADPVAKQVLAGLACRTVTPFSARKVE